MKHAQQAPSDNLSATIAHYPPQVQARIMRAWARGGALGAIKARRALDAAYAARPFGDSGPLDAAPAGQLDAPLGAAPAQDTPPAVEQAAPGGRALAMIARLKARKSAA